jgi:hypothetical protein
MIPKRLMDAWLNKKVSDPYFKILCVMFHHSADFHIKSSYLRSRFCHKTLSKYLPILESDGWISKETKKAENGSTYHLYHTNRLENVELYSDTPEYQEWQKECHYDQRQERHDSQATMPNDQVGSAPHGVQTPPLTRTSSNKKIINNKESQKHEDAGEMLKQESEDQTPTKPEALVKETLVNQYRRETGQPSKDEDQSKKVSDAERRAAKEKALRSDKAPPKKEPHIRTSIRQLIGVWEHSHGSQRKRYSYDYSNPDEKEEVYGLIKNLIEDCGRDRAFVFINKTKDFCKTESLLDALVNYIPKFKESEERLAGKQ